MKKKLFFASVMTLLSIGLLMAAPSVNLPVSSGQTVELSRQDWIIQSTGFSAASRGINYVHAVDENIVWAAAYDGSGAGQTIQEFTKTVNGGDVWTPGVINNASGLGIAMIFALDEDTAWAPMYSPTGTHAHQGIYKTTDGGANWSKQESATFDPSAGGFPNVVHFWDENIGFCQGDATDGYFELYTTDDGGENWDRVPEANIPPHLTGEWGVVGYYSVVGDNLWFGTNKGRVYKSTDRGHNWTVSETPMANTYTDVWFKDEMNGLVQDKNENSPGTIYKTEDGGDTWDLVEHFGPIFTNDMAYVPGTASTWISTGAATGNMGVSYSFNDGSSWTLFDGTDQDQFLATDWIDNQTGWIGAFNESATVGGMYKFNGTLEPPTPGYIEGTVTLVGGAGDVTEVTVTAGGITTNPDPDGEFSFEIDPGTYSVSAQLEGYYPDTVPGVVVEGGEVTSGVDLVLEVIPDFDPPTNLAIDWMTGLFTWDPPEGPELHQLSYHNNVPENAYFQQYDYGYGVVYDVSGYSDVTVEYTDYRHSSWGIFGEWDYKIHVVNWDTYELMHTTDVLQTEVNDGWELDIELGSLPASGLVGIFLEPMDNAPDDAYPCMDADAEATDSSYFGPLPNYSGMNLNSADVGNFLMDLWIMGTSSRDGERVITKAPMKNVTSTIEHQIRKNIAVNSATMPSNQHSITRYRTDPDGYNVYLNGNLEGFTEESSWQYEELINGETYIAGVSAVYGTNESEIVELEFTYEGTSADDNTVVQKPLLMKNYPNPFNPETTIRFAISQADRVQIEIFNIKGEKVRTLVDNEFSAGEHAITWDGTNDNQQSVASGIYLYRMKTANHHDTRKMILMK